MKSSPLLLRMAECAPSISIEVIWSRDPDAPWNVEDETINKADYEAWQSEVRATAIIGGKFITGHACLGGTREEFGTHPSESNPEISGYLPQMIDEALDELRSQAPELAAQIDAAIEAIKQTN